MVGIYLACSNGCFFAGCARPAGDGVADLLVGGKVSRSGMQSLLSGTIFIEFLLMGSATTAAFAVGEDTR